MRLTKKSGYHYYVFGIKEKENKNGSKRQYGKSITKLGQLEDILQRHNIETSEELDYLLSYVKQIKDIENELGIKLVILFNALKYGVYYRMSSGQITKDFVYLISNNINVGACDKLSFSFMTCFERQILPFEHYGKYWALTKEELEND